MTWNLLITLMIFLLFNSNTMAGTEVGPTSKYQQQNSKLIIYSSEVDLSYKGFWKIADSEKQSQAHELYLSRDIKSLQKEMPDFLKSKLTLQMEMERKIQDGAGLLRSFYSSLEGYAKLHDFVGPNSLGDLDPIKDKRVIELNVKTWTKRYDEQLTGEFAFLVPGVSFNPEKNSSRRLPRSKREELMIELRPYVDDGKHWILFNDGSIEREKIDPEIIKQYQLEIQPIITKDQPEIKPPEFQKYILVMVCAEDFLGSVSLTVENAVTGKSQRIRWDLAQAQIDESAVKNNLTSARRGHWRSYAVLGDTPVLSSWFEFYGDKSWSGSRGGRGGRQATELTAFKILGGRAAVEETLQMQAIARSSGQAEERNIPVETLTGVEVESHPFAEMLEQHGGPGPGLALAGLAPHDHFFVHVARPSTLLAFLEDGAEFISRFGGVINSNNLQYELTSKYLSRLGLDNKWLRMFLDSGEVEEMALIFPDLFFIDGTDVTTISRLTHPQPVQLLLRLIGVAGLSSGDVVEHVLDDGKKVFWTLLDNLLICSSSKSEMDRVIALHLANGDGSLGASDEFRYMLTQLPVEEETRIFAYISDPFIRHLVGPATKISQLRRISARQKMEVLSSRILLAKMDGIINQDSLEALIAGKYLPEHFVEQGYSIDRDLKVHSSEYGTLAGMQALASAPVEMVTKSEAASYKIYVDNYNRYWSRYFDPIAIRINDSKDGSLEMTTFILPLIDNSIYNGLRDILVSAEEGGTLQIPQPSLRPVMMLSLNLQEKGWMSINKGISRYISPRLLDDLASSIHLAIHDSDPVIASGSGDILGAFNSELVTGGGGGMMMFIPVALSVLTRPCTLFIETSNPENTLATLRGMTRKNLRQEGFAMDFYQLDGKDEWTMSLNIFGMIKLRYGIEVQGNYLLIRNIPWSNKEIISGVRTVPLKSVFLEAFPEACKEQLPGLFAAANENSRLSSQKNMAYLFPLLASGYASVDDLEKKHFDMFGFKPVHPEGGQWMWNGRHLSSSRFGDVISQKQPSYKGDTDGMGLLRNIDNVSLNMQFEDSGLRAILRWEKSAD
ncbi:MAG: hypothetical protein KKE17_10830 [Proteobacteria bacterium]|nr:hypothetical protein [Pseudomonadota bacterium]